ncbi:hypothetical protein SUDANB126_06851 [Streptomyces sp. enrichment culture]
MGTGQPASPGRQDTPQVHVRSLDADRFLVAAAGALGLRTAPQLAGTLHPLPLTGGHRVLVDLSGIAFPDSTGLTCLRHSSVLGHRHVVGHPGRRGDQRQHPLCDRGRRRGRRARAGPR